MLDERFDSRAQPANGRLSAHDGHQAVFQNQRRIKILDLQKPLGGLFQCFFRNQSNDLAGHGRDAVAGGLALHHLKDAVDRRLFKVGEVHRNLGQTAYQESSTFDEAHSAAGEAHGLGDLLGDFDVGRVEEYVVGNQEFARAYNGRARRGMHAGIAKVRAARGIGGNFGADAFELSTANVFQALAFRDSGSGFVEINRNPVALPDFLADVAGHGHAIFDGDAVDRDERNYVGGSHARMRTSMDIEVDEFSGFAHAADGGFLNRVPLAGEGNDATVVV